ncbi:MAG: tetratricopeptide repeat protein [Acidobacteriaceae bacterium]
MRAVRHLRLTMLFSLGLYGFMLLGVGAQRSAIAQASSAAGGSNVEREFQAAMAAKDQGDLDRAERLLLALHAAHPGIFAVDESLGLILVSRGEVLRALPLLQSGVREQPSSDAAHANLGAALYSLHRNVAALAELQEAARINPGNVSTQQSLGRLYLEMQKPDKAADAFVAAVELRPDDADLQLDCVTALLAADRLNEAQSILSTFAGADESARAQSLLGEVSEKRGQFQDAIAHLVRAAQLDPSEENAWQLGAEFLRHWTFAEAIREFEAAAVKFPASTRMRFGLGAAYYGAGRYGEAIPVFANLLDGDQNNAQYAKLLGMACTAPTDKPQPRCDALVTYTRAHPHDAVVATEAASMLLHQRPADDNVALARRLLTAALAADPKLADAQYEMGLLRQDQGDWAGSIANLKLAVKLKPDLTQAHYRLALAYRRTAEPQAAQSEMDLERKYAKQEQDDEDSSLRQITTFVVNLRN